MDVENHLLCKYTLKEEDLTKLRDAIEDLYYFEFVIGKILCLFLASLFVCGHFTKLVSRDNIPSLES